jgi:hypothetical protein
MATLAVAAVCLRVAVAVDAISATWKESRYPYDLFAAGFAEPGQFAHLAFAVGSPLTRFDDPIESSVNSRRNVGGAVETIVGVRWCHRLRADNAQADYRTMFAAEAALMKAILGMSSVDIIGGPTITSMGRRVVGDGTWILAEVQTLVRHRIDLV